LRKRRVPAKVECQKGDSEERATLPQQTCRNKAEWQQLIPAAAQSVQSIELLWEAQWQIELGIPSSPGGMHFA